jgi:hypothetical protein
LIQSSHQSYKLTKKTSKNNRFSHHLHPVELLVLVPPTFLDALLLQTVGHQVEVGLDAQAIGYVANAACYKGPFKNYVTLFPYFLDPRPPPLYVTFGVISPPPPPPIV